jgi:hypothetical protein
VDASRQSCHWQREYPLALALALTAYIFPCACSTCPSADVNGVLSHRLPQKMWHADLLDAACGQF